MKLNQIMVALVYRKKEPVPYNMNGQSGYSYPLIIDNGEDTTVINCTKEVHELVKPMETYIFETDLNTSFQNQKTRIINVFAVAPNNTTIAGVADVIHNGFPLKSSK